jgi:adenylosuccinate lyase
MLFYTIDIDINFMFKSLSPLDDRYFSKVDFLTDYFSEFAYCKFRIQVEIAWLEYVFKNLYSNEAQDLKDDSWQLLQGLVTDFDKEEFQQFQAIEKKIKHDVKAIEYYIKEKLQNTEWEKYKELVHFGLTSEDTNNIAYALMLKDFWKNQLLPLLADLLQKIVGLADEWRYTAMLARTHGQAASPTTAGKEIYNFAYRLYRKFLFLKNQTFLAKLNGATGNYQALQMAFPEVDWMQFSENFLRSLGLKQNIATTQIEPHDFIVEFFQQLQHTHSILIGMCQDMWNYISLEYFVLKQEANQVGSSTMPHKINPIDFENAEGNFGLANSLIDFFTRKLPISRMQRDLSDSTVLRNIGVLFGHSFLGFYSLKQGLEKICPNLSKLQNDLENHWEVLGESLQTLLRKNFVEQAYEKIKSASQNITIDENHYKRWIHGFDLPEQEKTRMLALTPATYTGLASQFQTDFILEEIKKYVHFV